MNSTIRATSWSVTLNMKNIKQDTADFCIAQARQKGWKVMGQKEKGKEGTEHYQLLVRTPHIRFSAVKKVFPTAHIEPARNTKALEQYVKKSDTRVGNLPEEDSSFVTTARLWDMIYELYNVPHAYGWDKTVEEVVLFREHDHMKLVREPLEFFDKCISHFIRRGINVDMLAINPGVRAFWKKFYPDILFRSRATSRQTDRRDELDSQSVNIPTYDEIEVRKDIRSPEGEEDSQDYEEGESETYEGDSTGTGDESCEEDDCEEY